MPAGGLLWDAAGMSQPAMSLFVVERRLPRISEHQLEVLQTALTGAASRFYARGDGVRYLSSIFLARQERLLSLFVADSAETVRAVNEAALIPFASIEPAVELPNPGRLRFLLPRARAAYADAEGWEGPGLWGVIRLACQPR